MVNPTPLAGSCCSLDAARRSSGFAAENAAAAFRTSSVWSVFKEPRHHETYHRPLTRSPPPFLPTHRRAGFPVAITVRCEHFPCRDPSGAERPKKGDHEKARSLIAAWLALDRDARQASPFRAGKDSAWPAERAVSDDAATGNLSRTRPTPGQGESNACGDTSSAARHSAQEPSRTRRRKPPSRNLRAFRPERMSRSSPEVRAVCRSARRIGACPSPPAAFPRAMGFAGIAGPSRAARSGRHRPLTHAQGQAKE